MEVLTVPNLLIQLNYTTFKGTAQIAVKNLRPLLRAEHRDEIKQDR
jgi:hypothetical protein